jgi:hypothetical protein
LKIVNQAGLLIKGYIQYEYSGISYSRASDIVAIGQQHIFYIPLGAAGVFIQIKSGVTSSFGKTIYENTFPDYEDVCLKVTGLVNLLIKVNLIFFIFFQEHFLMQMWSIVKIFNKSFQ